MHKSSDSRLPWEEVRFFLALAREGSLSGAARALGVEHSTVSRRVDTLEQALALRLFDRLPRGWQLTAEGEYLLPLAQGMEEESLALQRAAVGAGASRGVVRISAPPSFASLFLVPHIAAMRELWPEVELQIIGELREANLSRREADLALRMGRPQEATLAARPLARIGLGLYARRGYTQRDEALWEFVAAEERLTHLPHHHWLKGFAGPRRVALRSNDQIAVHGAVRAGLGLGLVPHFEARSDPELEEVHSATTPPPRELWLVLHTDVRRSPRVRAIADLVTRICEEAGPLLAG